MMDMYSGHQGPGNSSGNDPNHQLCNIMTTSSLRIAYVLTIPVIPGSWLVNPSMSTSSIPSLLFQIVHSDYWYVSPTFNLRTIPILTYLSTTLILTCSFTILSVCVLSATFNMLNFLAVRRKEIKTDCNNLSQAKINKKKFSQNIYN